MRRNSCNIFPNRSISYREISLGPSRKYLAIEYFMHFAHMKFGASKLRSLQIKTTGGDTQSRSKDVIR